MSDVQPDYTPFLNLVRPDLHDDVDTTINKIRDALDAIDTWAQAGGGGGGGGAYSAPVMGVRVIDATTPRDVDGNFAVLATDGTLLIDTSAMDPNTDYVALSLPMNPPVGTAIRAIRVSPDDNVSVYFQTGNSDPASYGGTDSSLYHQFEERIAVWAGSGLYGDHSDSGGWSIEGSGATTVWTLADFVFGSVPQDGIVNAIAYNANTGKWGTTGVNNPRSVVAINNAASGFTANAGMVVVVDATDGQTYVNLVNTIYSVVTVRKTDGSANPVTVQAVGGVLIDGAASFDLTAQNQTAAFIRDSGGAWHVISSTIDGAGGGGATAVSGLTDVDLTGLADGDFLRWNGADWAPVPYTLGQLGDVLDNPTADGQVLTWNATTGQWEALAPASGPLEIAGHPVVIGTLNDGDLIRFNAASGNWEDIGVGELGLPYAYATFVQPSQGPAANNSYTFGPSAFSISPETPAVILADATILANMVLPAAADAIDGSFRSVVLTFKKVDATANPVHITPQAGETIDGADHFDITTQYESVTIITDGTNWWVV